MKSAENRRAIVIGIFVLVGLVIFVTGVLVLGGQESKFVSHIRITSVFKNVSGLQVGNNVWFSGVKIGTVRTIRFIANSQVEVTMNVETQAQKYIRKNAFASISTDGLIGNRLVVISGGTAQEETVEANDKLQSQEALGSEQIMATLQENNKNLLKVTTDVKNIMDKIVKGKGTAGALLTDQALADQLRATMNNIQATAANASHVATTVSAFAVKLNTKGNLANDLVTDTTVYRNLKTSIARLNQATNSVVEVANNVRQTTTQLNEKLNSPSSPMGMLLNDQDAARSLKNTLRNLEGGSVTLQEDLEAVQHNFLFRGYFKKKAKEKETAAQTPK